MRMCSLEEDGRSTPEMQKPCQAQIERLGSNVRMPVELLCIVEQRRSSSRMLWAREGQQCDCHKRTCRLLWASPTRPSMAQHGPRLLDCHRLVTCLHSSCCSLNACMFIFCFVLQLLQIIIQALLRTMKNFHSCLTSDCLLMLRKFCISTT